MFSDFFFFLPFSQIDKEAEKFKKQESTYGEAMEALQTTIDRLSKENDALHKKLKPFEERGGRRHPKFSVDSATGEASAVDSARIWELHSILRAQKAENAMLKAKLAGVSVHDLKLVRTTPTPALREQFAAARTLAREFGELAASSTVVDLTKGPRRTAFVELEKRKETLLQKRHQAEEIEAKIRHLVSIPLLLVSSLLADHNPFLSLSFSPGNSRQRWFRRSSKVWLDRRPAWRPSGCHPLRPEVSPELEWVPRRSWCLPRSSTRSTPCLPNDQNNTPK